MSSAFGRVIRWLPVALFVVLVHTEAGIAGLTFVPGSENDLLVRKLGHAAVYGLLALLVQWATRPGDAAGAGGPGGRWGPWITFVRDWLIPLAVVAVVATADEVWQLGAVGRQGKATDALTDLTGAIAALVLLRTWRYRQWTRRRRAAVIAGVAAAAPDGELASRVPG